MRKGIYLSIGEVSKLTGTHIKSLRYYDKIGVLKPAYIDPDTRYRYYDFSQLKLVDIIQFCVELGIPLRKLNELMEKDGLIHLTQLLEVSKEMAETKIRTIQDGLNFIDDLQLEIQQNDQISPYDPPNRIDFPDIYYMLEPITESTDEKEFYLKLRGLYAAVAKQGYKSGYKFGLLYRFRTNAVERYQFIDILPTTKNGAKDIIKIPAGPYIVRHIQESRIEKAKELFAEIFKTGQDVIVVETELVTGLYNAERPLYELRCSVPDLF
ncbi:MerR-type HTH domain [Syntrophomonas zehnderi OL-4]|uniref:MerR-type HTH domain n=1 Tax=Syntrophomonas zehnderi OL-4 TaxID=690567 RepID=A0A0E4GC64_9FIRM|nr:MerR family transcriptional regulator [Syntrophomonas zehnderi]CFX05527.1 MerR-type HTH domain [Syntrophomonas zehnderi OL-4]CFX34596.1 MerR-type HTH domain [Syntrophomonas zehnderi OL-4]